MRHEDIGIIRSFSDFVPRPIRCLRLAHFCTRSRQKRKDAAITSMFEKSPDPAPYSKSERLEGSWITSGSISGKSSRCEIRRLLGGCAMSTDHRRIRFFELPEEWFAHGRSGADRRHSKSPTSRCGRSCRKQLSPEDLVQQNRSEWRQSVLRPSNQNRDRASHYEVAPRRS